MLAVSIDLLRSFILKKKKTILEKKLPRKISHLSLTARIIMCLYIKIPVHYYPTIKHEL